MKSLRLSIKNNARVDKSLNPFYECSVNENLFFWTHIISFGYDLCLYWMLQIPIFVWYSCVRCMQYEKLKFLKTLPTFFSGLKIWLKSYTENYSHKTAVRPFVLLQSMTSYYTDRNITTRTWVSLYPTYTDTVFVHEIINH